MHKAQRRIMLPAFSPARVAEMRGAFESKARQLVEMIPKGEPVDLLQYLTYLTVDAIGIVAFGFDFDTLRDPTNKLYEDYRKLFESTGLSVRNVLNLFVPGMRLLPDANLAMRNESRTRLRAVVGEMVDKRKADSGGHTDLLSRLMDAGLDGEELIDQGLTFLSAGQETTATQLSWTLYLMLKNGEAVLARARDDSEYLDACIKESLRLYPAAPLLSRQAKQDSSPGGIFVPKGTVVMYSPMLLGEKIGGREFKPERWLDADKGKHDAYMPFYFGNHACIGQRLAQEEMRVVLDVLLQSLDFQPVPGMEEAVPRLKTTMRAKDGIWASVERR